MMNGSSETKIDSSLTLNELGTLYAKSEQEKTNPHPDLAMIQKHAVHRVMLALYRTGLDLKLLEYNNLPTYGEYLDAIDTYRTKLGLPTTIEDKDTVPHEEVLAILATYSENDVLRFMYRSNGRGYMEKLGLQSLLARPDLSQDCFEALMKVILEDQQSIIDSWFARKPSFESLVYWMNDYVLNNACGDECLNHGLERIRAGEVASKAFLRCLIARKELKIEDHAMIQEQILAAPFTEGLHWILENSPENPTRDEAVKHILLDHRFASLLPSLLIKEEYNQEDWKRIDMLPEKLKGKIMPDILLNSNVDAQKRGNVYKEILRSFSSYDNSDQKRALSIVSQFPWTTDFGTFLEAKQNLLKCLLSDINLVRVLFNDSNQEVLAKLVLLILEAETFSFQHWKCIANKFPNHAETAEAKYQAFLEKRAEEKRKKRRSK